MPFPHAILQVEMEFGFLPHTVKVVEDAQALQRVQFLAAGIQLVEAAGDIVCDTVKEGARFPNVLLVGGYCDIPFLHHAV